MTKTERDIVKLKFHQILIFCQAFQAFQHRTMNKGKQALLYCMMKNFALLMSERKQKFNHSRYHSQAFHPSRLKEQRHHSNRAFIYARCAIKDESFFLYTNFPPPENSLS